MKKALLTILCVCSIVFSVKAEPTKYWDKSFWKNATVKDVQELIVICNTQKQKEQLQKCYDDNLFNLSRDTENSEVIEYIIHAGANVNAQRGILIKQTPLNAAIQNNPSYKVIAKLIKLGATVRKDDFETACRFTKNPKIISLLVKKGADVNKPNKNGYTPLMVAAQQNSNPDIITELVKQKARLEDKDDMGQTALFWAVSMNKNSAVIEALLNAGANVNAVDEFGKRAFDYAKKNKNLSEKVLKRLK